MAGESPEPCDGALGAALKDTPPERIGAAILVKVSGEMILSDPVITGVLQPWWQNLTGASDAAAAYGRLQLGVELVCFAAIFLLAAGYALKYDEHVRVDVFFSKMSTRTQTWVDVIGGVVFVSIGMFLIGLLGFVDE